MDLRGASLLSVEQFNRDLLEDLFSLAEDFSVRLKRGERIRWLDGKLLATVFYEPSTRTRLSFEAAMLRLGGGVLSVADAKAESSVAKGETLADTIRIIANYADAIVLRHHDVGSSRLAAEVSPVPVLNAGDGSGEHPTQALLDLFTIRAEKGTIDGLRIALVGDLKNGRTVHSLARALSLFRVDISFVATRGLSMPSEVHDYLINKGVRVRQTHDLEEAVKHTDVVYMTRVQKERIADRAEYEQVRNSFVVNRAFIQRVNEDILILHPLPRIDEIAQDVDTLPNAAYFRQARNGVLVRMALLARVLGN